MYTRFKQFHMPSFAYFNRYTAQSFNYLFLQRICVLMTNKLKIIQIKYLSIRYLKKYIKLPLLLFTFLIFKDSFLE